MSFVCDMAIDLNCRRVRGAKSIEEGRLQKRGKIRMRTYTLSELSMLADLPRHLIIEILHDNGISISERSDDAELSDEALQAIFRSFKARSRPSDVHKLFDEKRNW